MSKIDYENPIRRQVFSLAQLVQPQLESCFGEGLKDLMTMAEIFDARKIILTGCGDSYAAAVAMGPVIAKYCDCFGVQVMRAVEFTRFLSKAQIGIGEPNSPLVIVVSAGGNTARVCEALEKANQVGAFSILLTNRADSPAAAKAKRVYVMGTPDFEAPYPGLRSYFASMVGMIAFASRMGHVRGTLPPTGPADFQKAITAYVGSYAAVLESMDDQIFALAQSWKDITRFDFIGDDVEYGSAFFGAAKFVECAGSTVTTDDSEDWCHINYFLKDPQSIGTVFMADCNAPSFSRVLETITSAVAIGRRVLVVTNTAENVFCEGATVCVLPQPPAGYEWMQPLLDFIPASLLAGYIAKLQGVAFFRRELLPDGTPDAQNPFADSSCMTINNSKIEIYE